MDFICNIAVVPLTLPLYQFRLRFKGNYRGSPGDNLQCPFGYFANSGKRCRQ